LPITTAPEIAYPPFEGLIINFATGNAFGAGDFPKTTVTQRVFGIWDRPDFAVSGGRVKPPSDLTTLVARTYARRTNGNIIVTSASSVDWATKDGWYFSLPGSSEMVLSDPDLRAGVLAFTSVRPNTAVDQCSATPSVSLFTIDPLSGAPEKNNQGTTTIDGVVYLNAGTETSDQKVRIVNDRTKRAFTKECRKGDPDCTCTTVSGNEKCEKTAPTCAPGQSALRVVGQGADTSLCYTSNGRVQWREIQGLRTDQ
jgi:type IV pilus assembly protein PilY1